MNWGSMNVIDMVKIKGKDFKLFGFNGFYVDVTCLSYLIVETDNSRLFSLEF